VPVIVQLVGSHRSGKTLTLTRVVRALRRRRLSVVVVKHSHHRIDLAGTDTDRYARSGATAVFFASDRTVGFLPGSALAWARRLRPDVVLIEGDHRHRRGRRFVIGEPAASAALAREIVAFVTERSPRRTR